MGDKLSKDEKNPIFDQNRIVLKGFTVERLIGFLVGLGRDIEIKIGSAKDTAGKIKVRSAA